MIKKSTEEFNDYQDWYKKECRVVRRMIKGFIRSVPKSHLIPVLKEMKIIEQDWNRKGNKYVAYNKPKVSQ